MQGAASNVIFSSQSEQPEHCALNVGVHYCFLFKKKKRKRKKKKRKKKQ